MKRSGRKSAAQTPAPKKEQIFGSKKNPKGSAASKKSAASIYLSESIVKTLSDKRAKFIKEHPNQSVSLATLKAVMRRGMGAYSSSHRPTITSGAPNSRQAWGFARVNKFLLKKGGTKVKAAYVQDDDLMEKGGRIFSKGGFNVLKEENRLDILNIDETHKYLQEKYKAYKKENSKLKDLPSIYIRAGLPKIKKDGTFDVSKNGDTGDKEDGVSVFNAKYSPNSDFVFVDLSGGWGYDINLSYRDSQFYQEKGYDKYKRKMYLVSGNKVGYGSDGEVLLDNKTIKIIGLLNPDKIVPPKSFIKEYMGGFKKLFSGKEFVEYPKYEKGAILNSSCKTYISENESVLKNGYYLNLSEFSSMIDPYGQIPLNLNHTLVTYNSGNQEGLSLIDTINPISLQNELADILNIPINNAQVVVGLYIEMGKKLKSISQIEGNNIIVIDRDKVVCKSEIDDDLLKKGGKVQSCKTKGKGDCYKAAGDFAIGKFFAPKIDFKGEPYIVHAEVAGQGSLDGLRYGHAWVEDDFFVYDYSNNREIVFPKEIYYLIGKVNTKDPKKYQRYTFDEARKKMLDTGNYGSWDIETEYAVGGNLDKNITCVNCGWTWNTRDSQEFDKYVCHRCGFDNRTYYDSEPIGKYHLGGDMSKHLAPNGKPSNLTHEQWHLVRTPQFKAWFGDWENDPENASKVVDENGEPLVVYHGTYAKEQFKSFDFDKADLGFHFGTYKQAKDRSETKIGLKGYKSIITPFFLSITELFNILDVGEFEYPPKYLTQLIANYVITEKEVKENNFDKAIYRQDNKKIRNFLKAKYGENVGFQYENTIEGEGKSFIALQPNQVKLADGSNTMFDSENPDIRYEDGGLVYALEMSMTNLKKNGIVITDNDKNITLIAYNTGNQERRPSLYNKSLIYKSVQPIKSANQIIQKFDLQEFENFDDKKIKDYQHKHLIILNQNEVVYDSENPDIRFNKGGIMENKIYLPDTESNYYNLEPILAKQGYELKKIIKPTKTVSEIAEDFDLEINFIQKQLNIGTEHELEHSYSTELAEKTALHHLAEDPEYYMKLKSMEMQTEAEKLEDYYKTGGPLNKEFTCEILDENGERQIDLESIESLTECISNLPQTKSMHFDYEKNDYYPYRKQLHRDLIYKFKKDLICVEREEPIAILMGGSPASGKSTFLKKYAPYLLKEEIFKIDADEIRAKLPEYKGYNASQTHLETKDIVNTLLSDRNIGIPCRFDLIYDGTMNNTKSYAPLIKLLKNEGYKVFIVYIDRVPKDVIVKRALERYKKSGRFVPLEVIDDFFEKGTAAFEQLKKEVDGYMLIDGSNQDYKIIERGGDSLPQDRNYSKIGEPIKITSEEVVRELKRGGELNPDDPNIKSIMTHKSGSAGGLLVGKRHSEGGIKAVNKSTGQPLEMEGGEVVITRDAVSDDTKREFEGEMLTNREILSKINESGGGVSFASGGDIPDRCACSGKSYNYGGKLMKDNEIVDNINKSYKKLFGIQYPDLPPSEAMKKIFANKFKYEKGGSIFEDSGSLIIVDKKIPSFLGFSKLFNHTSLVPEERQYKNFLKENYNIIFEDLPYKIQSGLMLGNQKLIDNYINN